MLEKNISINDELAKFIYLDNILDSDELTKLEQYLDTLEFRSGKLGKSKEIPRQQLWFHQNQKYFCDEWKCKYPRWESNTYSTILQDMQKKINDITNKYVSEEIIFNSCLINKYRDGTDSIKPHRDTPISFGEYPIISGLSLKSSRKIVIKPIEEDVEQIEFVLAPNSLFIMTGASQKYFTHEIPKNDSKLERYSLTFRKHLL
jgi:alkylated DNA repair dioxygenase AlkB